MKNGLSRAMALRRINSQMSEPEMEKLAHFVIANDGTIAELEHESELAWMIAHDLVIIRDRFRSENCEG
jgi:dephospho-CoA kinase